MITERTSVGLDVHARSVVAAAIDERTGELVRRRMGSETAEVVAWVTGLPGPVAATYEAVRDDWRDVGPVLTNLAGEPDVGAALNPWEAKVYTR